MAIDDDGRPQLPFSPGVDYRETLLNKGASYAEHARFVMHCQVGLAMCVIAETQRDRELPDFLEDTILSSVDDAVDEGGWSLVDATKDFAVFELKHMDGATDDGALVSLDTLASRDAERAWPIFLAGAIYEACNLESDGTFPQTDAYQDGHYIFDEDNSEFSNDMLEAQCEVAEVMIKSMWELNNSMVKFLKERLSLQGDVQPYYFLQTLRVAHENGEDISQPLSARTDFTWFDRHYHGVVATAHEIAGSGLSRSDMH